MARKTKKKKKFTKNSKKTKSSSKKKRRSVLKAKPVYRGQERRLERRLSPRLPICARVRWGNVENYYFTRDISQGGLFLLTNHPPPLHKKLLIELSIQYLKEPLRLEAQTVRYESDQGRAVGCGVRLIKTNQKLNTFLKGMGSAMPCSS
jgi:hypothetical protein